jgi:cation:H+ antiporter
MSASALALLIVGIAILVVGAELLVRGASRIATRTGISSIVIGLTVVAFGTSTPELAVSVSSSLDDKADLAIGNVVGSNIANILLVLGLAAAVGGGLTVAQRIVRLDVPVMIGVSVLVWLMAIDRRISTIDGIVLVVGLLAYTGWTLRQARRPDPVADAEYDQALDDIAETSTTGRTSVWIDLGLVVIGLAGLVIGARLLVDSASEIARGLGVPDLVIGLTVVAVGTSMPEIATSVVAAARGERDLAVGNAIGSNLFNLLCVLGLTAVVAPGGVPVSDGAVTFDIPVMTAVAIAALPIFFNGFALKRWEGIVFLAYYALYVTFLVLDATDHAARDGFAAAMTTFVLPLTAITLVVVGARASRARGTLATT